MVALREELAAMSVQTPKTEEVCVEDAQGTVCAASLEGETSSEAAEPWLPIETKLIAGSVIAGTIALIVLATLVNMYLLRGH